jgi:hypothetical protein
MLVKLLQRLAFVASTNSSYANNKTLQNVNKSAYVSPKRILQSFKYFFSEGELYNFVLKLVIANMQQAKSKESFICLISHQKNLRMLWYKTDEPFISSDSLTSSGYKQENKKE